jgi:hypothetical protein
MAVVMHLRGRAAARDALEAVVVSLRWVVLLAGRAAAADARRPVLMSCMLVFSLAWTRSSASLQHLTGESRRDYKRLALGPTRH